MKLLGELQCLKYGLLAACGLVGTSHAESLSFFGTPGLIDMPSAGALADGDLAFTSANFGPIWRNSLSFQLSPRVTAAFRYSAQGSLESLDERYYDRSFDLHFLLREEDERGPSIALGLRDFGGSGIYGGEYLVVSKHVTPRLQLSGGIGWGRFAGRGNFDNPLTLLGSGFDQRPSSESRRTGEFSFDHWFRGDAALFGGLRWQASERLTVVAEYSSDTYRRESRLSLEAPSSPFNVGVSYRFRNGADLGAYYMYGNRLGLRFSYTVNPTRPRAPGGQEAAPPPLLPRERLVHASWIDAEQGESRPPAALARGLSAQGLRLLAYRFEADEVSIEVENLRFDVVAQAAGRAARILANSLPPRIGRFSITFREAGIRQSTVTVSRSDLEELEYALEGAWHSYARAGLSDAFGAQKGDRVAGAYPRLSWGIAPYAAFSLFDPESPLRYELGVQVAGAYEPTAGLIFSGRLRRPLAGTIGDAGRRSDSVLPHVRSDAVLYARDADLQIGHLTAEYFYRPGTDLFGRLTFGYLEPMFAGVSAELLWYPFDSRLALGGELNYAVQRDYDQLFGLRDYRVWTGHVSAYYDLGRGYHGQLDIGRYLAGDWGATLTLGRRFANGVKVGAFATVTNVPFSDFGEGSFDKGLFFEVPLSWITGQPSRQKLRQVIRPVQRDGGARLEVRNRLYGVVSPYRGQALAGGWGKFLR